MDRDPLLIDLIDLVHVIVDIPVEVIALWLALAGHDDACSSGPRRCRILGRRHLEYFGLHEHAFLDHGCRTHSEKLRTQHPGFVSEQGGARV